MINFENKDKQVWKMFEKKFLVVIRMAYGEVILELKNPLFLCIYIYIYI